MFSVQVSIADRVPDYHPPLMIGGGQHDLLLNHVVRGPVQHLPAQVQQGGYDDDGHLRYELDGGKVPPTPSL